MSVPSEQRQTPTVYSVVNNQSFSFLDIPSFQIDNRSSSALSSTSQISAVSTDKGQAQNEAYFALVSRAIQVCLAGMTVLALTVQVIGHGPILRIAEILGFMLIFLGSFLICLVVYLWWSSWTRVVIGLDSYRTLKVYCICCLSEFVATLSNYVVDLGPLEHSPIDVAFYGILTLLLFSLFSSVIHEKGVAAMFNHETMFFVSLTVALHFIMTCLFENILPSFIYSQIVYSSCFLALSICLLLAKYHSYFSMAAIGQFVHTSIHGQKNLLPPTYSGRRFSNVSVLSNMSSVHPRNSLTSQSSFSYSIPSGHNFDLDTLNEAHGLLGDILFQESHLSQKGKESLKHIQEMLAPRVTRTAPYATRSRIGSNVSEDESDASSSIGVNPHLYGYRTSKIHRKSHRISSSQFTTTTTATGLPNVDQDPAERKRSLAPRDVRTRLSVAEGRPSVHQMHHARRERLGSHPSPLARQYKNSTPVSPTSDISDIDERRVRSSTFSSGQPSDNESHQPVLALKRVESEPTSSLKPVADNVEAKRRADSLPQRQIGMSNITVQPETDDVTTILEEILTEAASSETELEVSTPHALQPPKNSLSHSLHQLNVSLLNHYVVPSNTYSLEEYQQTKINLFDQVVEWDFPIFELEKVAGDHILSQMAYCLFLEAGLIETFRIPQREFINYFRAMEANYGTNAYHNKTHAADVLHATSFLLFEQIPEFSFEMSRSAERVWIGHQRGPSGGNIASALSILEVFACYMAAAMHDFDHPGRTNAFLVATKNPLAILYNDKSVLENHHAAASWDLLVSIPENNFLLDLDDAELKRFRFLLVECILATDLKLHFNIVREFKEKIEDGQAIDWSDDVDRLQVMKMIIKMADINTPTKSYQLHRSWTVRITEEFFQQHDDEIRLGLPQTIFMNRNEKEKLPAIQVSFIQNLVSPLFHASAAAGVIPGIIESESPGLDKKNDESIDLSDTEFGSDHALDEDDVSIPDEAPLPKIRKVISIILTNLEMNFQAWHDELPHEEDTLQDSEETKELEESDEIISQQSTKDPA